MSTSASRPDQPDQPHRSDQPVSGDLSADARNPADDDTTGIRALLAALPDPGPMPPSLVHRITLSLAAEQEKRAASERSQAVHPVRAARLHRLERVAPRDRSSAPGADQPDHSHISDTGHAGLSRRWSGGRRRRGTLASGPPVATASPRASGRASWQRSVLTVAGAAAAAVLVGTLGHTIVQGSGASGASSSAGAAVMSPESAAGSAGSSPAAAAPKAGSRQAGDSGAGTRLRANITVTVSGTAYTASTLATGARSLLTSPPRTIGSSDSEAPAIGPLGTPTGASACLDGLGVPGSDHVVVDLATYAGRPAAVLVVTDSHQGRRVYAVKRSCSAGHPDLLHQAVSLP